MPPGEPNRLAAPLGASVELSSGGVVKLDLLIHRDLSRLPQSLTEKQCEALLKKFSAGLCLAV